MALTKEQYEEMKRQFANNGGLSADKLKRTPPSNGLSGESFVKTLRDPREVQRQQAVQQAEQEQKQVEGRNLIEEYDKKYHITGQSYAKIDPSLKMRLLERGMVDKVKELEKGAVAQTTAGQFVPAVAEILTESERKFGQTLGDTAAVLTGQDEKINQAAIETSEANRKLAELLKRPDLDPQQRKNIQAQLDQNIQLETAEQAIPSINKSAKEIIGEGVGVGADILGAGTFGAGAKGAKSFQYLNKAQQAANKGLAPAAKTTWQALRQGAITKGAEGAVFGGAQGLSQGLQEEGATAESIAKSTATGAVTGGLIGGAFGALDSKIRFDRTPKQIDKLKQEAIEQYRQGIQVSKEKFAEMQDKVIPELLEEGTWGTFESLMNKADEGIELSRAEYKKLGELQGIIETDGVINKIDDELASMRNRSGEMVSVNEPRFKALEKLRKDIMGAKDKAMIVSDEGVYSRTALQKDIQKLTQAYGDELYETRKSMKTVEDNKILSQVKKVDGMLRELLNTKNPDRAKVNKLYTFSNNLKDVLLESEKAQKKGFVNMREIVGRLGFLTAGTTAGAAGGGLKAVLGGLALTALNEIRISTWYNTLSAVRKNALANKLAEMSTREMGLALIYMSKVGIKAVNEILGGTEQETDTQPQEKQETNP